MSKPAFNPYIKQVLQISMVEGKGASKWDDVLSCGVWQVSMQQLFLSKLSTVLLLLKGNRSVIGINSVGQLIGACQNGW